jgi:hypothetical protein
VGMKTRLIALLVLIITAEASVASAASFVQQRYRFIALTSSWPRSGQSQHVVWIVEDRSGEGYSSMLLQIALQGDDSPVLLQTELKDYGDWQWLHEGAGRLRTEQFEALWETQGVFSYDNYALSIQSPEPNEELSEAFRDFIRQGHKGARAWNDAQGTEGFDPPRLQGVEWELAYYYPGGLYIGYEITDAYYFPHPRYLLLFTHQDMLETGMDTMHGFIILRLNSGRK